MASQLARLVNRINGTISNEYWRTKIMSFALGTAVKFAGTANVDFLSVANDRIHLRLKNRRKVQNHIGSVHAAAMALLAETATGFVVGMNVPDNRLVVIKSMKVDFVKLAKGDMEAVSHLTPEHLAFIKDNEKGHLQIPVKVTDSTGAEPVTCEMVWAWLPRTRKEKGADKGAPSDAKAKL
eukprot:Opistho-1_new@48027